MNFDRVGVGMNELKIVESFSTGQSLTLELLGLNVYRIVEKVVKLHSFIHG